MRPITRGEQPAELVIKQYRYAAPFLVQKLGCYCSYCEMRIPAGLAVEHVQPKLKRADLKLTWDNFLLACSICNSIKGDQDINLSDYYWQDQDNTFSIFCYSREGITVNESLNPKDKEKSKRTLRLTGLNRFTQLNRLDILSQVDNRLADFIQVWEEAKAAKNDLDEEPSNKRIRNLIVKSAIAYGHFILPAVTKALFFSWRR
ncbi:MAG: HNH endonuclease [Planctomycetaceae bacterium]|jgi:uncharacterized protein (TIGR02646 family)|nr:HNH endonuclease [Planctomycetaceae bacterium]